MRFTLALSPTLTHFVAESEKKRAIGYLTINLESRPICLDIRLFGIKIYELWHLLLLKCHSSIIFRQYLLYLLYLLHGSDQIASTKSFALSLC